MNNVNKTLYIPLYGKSYVSSKGIILNDPTAEYIWQKEKFDLKRKSKNKFLSYYMAMRAKVFDTWLIEKISHTDKDITVLHIGCGMDSRNKRVENKECAWYDVDLPEVITERKKYFSENKYYHLISADARDEEWIESIPKTKTAIVIMEGFTMYIRPHELKAIINRLGRHFDKLHILADFYSVRAAKLSKYKNPVNDVGVNVVYGMDEGKDLEESTDIMFIKNHDMTPGEYINELKGIEKIIFKKLYAGKFAKNLYKIYEYEKQAD